MLGSLAPEERGFPLTPRKGVNFTEDGKITVQRLEQSDIWQMRRDYGQHAYCYQCSKVLAPGDLIVKVRTIPRATMRESSRRALPRLYHAKCFNGSGK